LALEQLVKETTVAQDLVELVVSILLVVVAEQVESVELLHLI
jgi:hypothetical protein